MIENVNLLIRDIRVALDMNRKDTALIEEEDIDTLDLDELIRSKIETAARLIEERAPVSLLDSGKPLSGSISFKEAVGKGRGRLALPDDFMRLITFKMSDWERAVTEPITETDPRYGLQSSRYAGIRGTPQKPVVAIVSEPTGLVLEFWSCTGGENVKLQRGRYLPIPRIREDGIEICEKLRSAVVAYTASLVSLATGDTARAAALREEAEGLGKIMR